MKKIFVALCLMMVCSAAMADTLTLPESLTEIKDKAFYGDTSLEVVVVPSGVKRIGKQAFAKSSLKEITYPAGIQSSVEKDAFEGIDGTALNLGNTDGTVSVIWIDEEIEEEAFKGSKITSIDIPEGVTSIGKNAFRECTNLTSITIPKTVTSIGYGAFCGCTSLKSVKFAEGSELTSLEDLVFGDCKSLTEITIPDGVTSIGWRTFLDCESLTNVTFSGSVESIGDQAFSCCTGLEKITLGSGVKTIGSNAFGSCRGLTDITIPEGVTSIGIQAFSDCRSLADIVIPDSVESIGEAVFYKCIALESMTLPFVGSSRTAEEPSDAVLGYLFGSIAYEGGTATTQQYAPSASKTYYIPDSLSGVTVTGGAIPYGAFRNCVGVTHVTLSKGVTGIGARAFTDSGLTEITYPESAEVASDAFDAVYGICRESTEGGMISRTWDWNAAKGDILTFGHYEQDNETTKGQEGIEWVVLDLSEDGKQALVISRYGLDRWLYQNSYKDVTWETCYLRKWLNEGVNNTASFLSVAFTADEQDRIAETDVDNSDEQCYDWTERQDTPIKATGGNDTKDRLFLLSYAEANTYFGVIFDEASQIDLMASRISPTAYAMENGVSTNEKYLTEDGAGACTWWLRSPGIEQSSASCVNMRGTLSSMYCYDNDIAVRPAMWLKL